ncbi:hypothetical protein L1887_40713 [Cichorium endivia]|nr:hypothetical protein L1887_40713 [Cichorium endivia]
MFPCRFLRFVSTHASAAHAIWACDWYNCGNYGGERGSSRWRSKTESPDSQTATRSPLFKCVDDRREPLARSPLVTIQMYITGNEQRVGDREIEQSISSAFLYILIVVFASTHQDGRDGHDAHPMGVLVSAMGTLSVFHPDANPAVRGQDLYKSRPVRDRQIVLILGKGQDLFKSRPVRDRQIVLILGKEQTQEEKGSSSCLTFGFLQHATAVIDDKMYIFGGNHNGRYLNDLQTLDLRNWTWSKVEVKPNSEFPVTTTPCAGHSLIPWEGNKLISIAGHSKDPSEVINVKAFDLQTNTWSPMKTYGKSPGKNSSDEEDLNDVPDDDVSDPCGYVFVSSPPLHSLTA